MKQFLLYDINDEGQEVVLGIASEDKILEESSKILASHKSSVFKYWDMDKDNAISDLKIEGDEVTFRINAISTIGQFKGKRLLNCTCTLCFIKEIIPR